MSAKKSKKSANRPASASSPPVSVTAATPAVVAAGPGAGAAEAPFVPWIESNDPKRRLIGKIVLVGVWIYVAALWLLALDQTFNWGIFGPKVPPVP